MAGSSLSGGGSTGGEDWAALEEADAVAAAAVEEQGDSVVQEEPNMVEEADSVLGQEEDTRWRWWRWTRRRLLEVWINVCSICDSYCSGKLHWRWVPPNACHLRRRNRPRRWTYRARHIPWWTFPASCACTCESRRRSVSVDHVQLQGRVAFILQPRGRYELKLVSLIVVRPSDTSLM
jgi:hypothetical protein